MFVWLDVKKSAKSRLQTEQSGNCGYVIIRLGGKFQSPSKTFDDFPLTFTNNVKYCIITSKQTKAVHLDFQDCKEQTIAV